MNYRIFLAISCLFVVFDDLKAPFFEGWSARKNTTVEAENDVRNNVRTSEVNRSEVKVPVEVRAQEQADVNKMNVDKILKDNASYIKATNDMIVRRIQADPLLVSDVVKSQKLQADLAKSLAVTLGLTPEQMNLALEHISESPQLRVDWSQSKMSLQEQVSSWISRFLDWLLGRQRSIKSEEVSDNGIELNIRDESLEQPGDRVVDSHLAKAQLAEVEGLVVDASEADLAAQDRNLLINQLESLKQALKDAGIAKLILGGPNANGTVINSIIAKYFKDGLPEDISRASLFEANPDSSGFLSGIGNNINLSKVEGLNVDQKSAKSLQSANPIVQDSINKLTQSVLTQKDLNKLSLSSIESLKEQGARIIADELVSDATKLIVRNNLELLKTIDVSALQAKKQASLDSLNSKLSITQNSNEAKVRDQIKAQVESDFNAKKSEIELLLIDQFGDLLPELMKEHLDVEKEMMLDAAYETEGNKALITEAQQKDEDQLKASAAASKRKISTSTTSPEQLKASQRNKQIRDIQTNAVKEAQNQIAEQVRINFASNEQAVWDNNYLATHPQAKNPKNKAAVTDMNRARNTYIQKEIDAVLAINKSKIEYAGDLAAAPMKLQQLKAFGGNLVKANKAVASSVPVVVAVQPLSDQAVQGVLAKLKTTLTTSSEKILPTLKSSEQAREFKSQINRVLMSMNVPKDSPLFKDLVKELTVNPKDQIASWMKNNKFDEKLFNDWLATTITKVNNKLADNYVPEVKVTPLSDFEVQAQVKSLQKIAASSKQLMIGKPSGQAQEFKSQINRVLMSMDVPKDSPLFKDLATELTVDFKDQIASWKNPRTKEFDAAKFNNWLTATVIKVNDRIKENQ